ncbi:MAG: zinc ribbon domain-containing protein [Treponema sp.]|nr:zinc ribbon domain-containing protein [Treponema sp.]
MNKIHICRGCGRTVDSSFLYCPWCGFSRINREGAGTENACREDDNFDGVFKQLEFVQQKNCENRLARMFEQLDELEKELDTIVLSTEMHK